MRTDLRLDAVAGQGSKGMVAAYDVADVQHTVEHVAWRFGAVDGWTTLARSGERTFGVLLRILGGRERLAVLLRGEGPEIDIPSLD